MFKKSKYTTWYNSIVSKAKFQNRQKLNRKHPDYVYYEKHHIIPKALNGTNTPDNLVLLTAKEHFIVHLLLPKMCISTKHMQQMLTALFRLKQKNSYQSERYFNSRLYEFYKKKIVCLPEKKQKHINRVTCKHIITGEFLQVTREEFDSSDLLVGVNYGKKQSTEQKHKHSLRMKGTNNPFYGKTHDPEIRQRINRKVSLSTKGRPKSDECKRKMKESWKRRKQLQNS